MAARAALVCAVLALGPGCSLLAADRTACTESSECEQAFGPGATCAPSGYCQLQPGGNDGGIQDAGQADASLALELADQCQQGMPALPVAEGETAFLIDTTDLGSDVEDLGACLPSGPVPGKDGFIAVDMKAGEKWHFHLSPTDRGNTALDLAAYVLLGCDVRTCQPGDAIDLCGPGEDEHFSYTARQSGLHYIGADSVLAGGELLSLLVSRPSCGNGRVEHSEACDDGNTVALDGCDPLCRGELTAARSNEQEVNDDVAGANVIVLGQDTTLFTARGNLGGRCDYDVFAISVPEGTDLEVDLLNAIGMPCPDEISGLTLELVDKDGIRILGKGASRGSNRCPAIDPSLPDDAFAAGLSAGTYFVRVSLGKADAASVQLPYQLRIQLLP